MTMLDPSFIEKIFTLLTSSPNGLTAKEIGERLDQNDLRNVRESVRAALKIAGKRKLTTSAQRIKGSAIKIYNIIPKQSNRPSKDSKDES